MKRSRKKPAYPYDIGAYSSSPRINEQADGTYRATGSIQSWRGSIEDLVRAAQAAVAAIAEESGSDPRVRASITDWQGRQHEYDSLQAFSDSGNDVSPDQITTVRIEATGRDDDIAGTVVARRTMPGVVLSVAGSRHIAVDGLARLWFRRLMRGYVDRYAGVWRPAAAMAVTLVPMSVTFALFIERDGEWPDWLRGVELVVGLGLTFLVMVNSWQWTLIRTPLEFVPDDARPGEGWRSQLLQVVRRPRVARILAFLGLLVVGIVTNKLSDLIPWP